MADKRFDALSTDPRFRLPNRKESRTAVDPRFKRVFKDKDFRQKAAVDRYGRKVDPNAGKQKLKKLYRVEKDDRKARPEQSRGREVVGSSEEESDDEDESEDESEDETALKKRDPARQGGFSESESEEESDSDEASVDDEELAEETAGHEQTEEIPMGEVSRRIAAVNLDWDNIRATDIMAVAQNFISGGGNVESVTIYPSEFGRERLEREELEGPPREIFASSKRKPAVDDDDSNEDADDDEDDTKIERQLQQEQVNEGDEFDTAKLRQYQLERLRYYYAVITCSNKTTAKAIYDSMDGREYLTSANFFDLRFIPDGVTFDDDKPRDECTKLPDGYNPNEFRTEALTHSNVRLTWDDDDPTRKEVQKRAFSRVEMDENDLQAYIGSDSSDAESVTSRKSAAEDRKAKKREAERAKMRAALGLAEASKTTKAKKSDDEVVGDMQITFTSGLGTGEAGGKDVFENEPQDEESTKQRYIRKERDRKQKRKEKTKASRTAEPAAEHGKEPQAAEAADAGFDDPFFTDPAAAAAAEKKAKKDKRKQKLADQAAQDEEAAARRAELELLMAEDQGDSAKHFDMREIEKAEKEARRKGKKDKKRKKPAVAGSEEANGGFEMETEDPRFKALFESHEFAIDPTNPKFKKTEGMSKLLEEGRKKRKLREVDEGEDVGDANREKAMGGAGDKGELDGLVKRLKGGSKSKR